MKEKKIKNQKLSVTSVKQRHKELIFHFLLENNTTTRTQIAKALNISNATVGTIVDELLSAKLIHETNSLSAGIGRKPNIIEVSSNQLISILIDLRKETTLLYHILNVYGETIYTKSFSIESSYEDSLNALFIDATLYEKKTFSASILGVCVCIPGIFTKETDTISLCNIQELSRMNLYQMIQAHFNTNIFIDNDINLATRAYLASRYTPPENFLFVYLGTGVGSSLVINGELYEGKYGFAGEIGQMKLPNYTTLEENISSKTFEKIVNSYFQSHNLSEAIQIINEKYMEEDPIACNIISQIITDLSFSLTNIIWTMTPDIIYLSGYLNILGDKFIEELRIKIYDSIPTFFKSYTRIEFAKEEILNINIGATSILLQKWIHSKHF